MPLEEYRAKRHAAKTPEPAVAEKSAASSAGDRLRFVVQEHHSRALHWDFRLELDGVLLSWAVPKGPSLDPKAKRLAVHVEDHPVEYGCFQGDIPAGEYGAGQVYVWDTGTWEPLGDPHAGLTKGDFKFTLHGTRLHGLWVLVRMKPRPGDKRENWLLIKERDEFVRPESEYSITAEERGALIAEGPECDWVPPGAGAAGGDVLKQSSAASPPAELRATPPAAPAPASRGSRTRRPAKGAKAAKLPDPAQIPGAKRSKLPAFVAPALATLVPAAPLGEEWVHEVKFDGYRLLARIDDGKVRLLTRSEQDWTDRFPALAAALAGLPVSDAMLDGELVSMDSDGRSSFGALQDAIAKRRTDSLVYYAFDLLRLGGYDLTRSPLVDRKLALEALVAAAPADGPLRYSAHVVGSGEEFRARACEFKLEGIVSKRADGAYLSGRSRAWQKSKCLLEQEFVVIGWTKGQGARSKLGALIVGYYRADGTLASAGRVGTGFTDSSIASLLAALTPLEVSEAPVASVPAAVRRGGVHWVRPELVAEVRFAEWTRDGRLRQPVFLGLREDKAAREVVDESASAEGAGDAGVRRSDSPRSARRAAGTSAGLAADPRISSPGDGIVKEGGKTVGYVAGVRLTHPERELFGVPELTKFDLARYYEDVAHRMLPHLAGRPTTLVRCPHGIAEGCFYQRHLSEREQRPPHVSGVSIPGMTVTEEYICTESLEGILELVQLGALEFHVWGCRTSDPEHPDRLVFDLDPDVELPFDRVIDAANIMRTAVEAVGLSAWVKTTGGKGLHVVVPLKPTEPWPRAEEFARALVMRVVEAAPDRYTANMRKAVRVGAVFLDYVRNTKSSSAVAPYSTRAREGGPVATPLSWDELTPKLDPARFTTAAVRRRLTQPDPWEGFAESARGISDKMRSDVGLD